VEKGEKRLARQRRHTRVRGKVKGNLARPRLCVFRSLTNIYAQVIDDVQGVTLASASTLNAEVKSSSDGKNKTAKSGMVGSLIAKQALSHGIKQVAFDRGGYKYHGRVKALADAARQEGLQF